MDFATPDRVAKILDRVRAIVRDEIVPLEPRFLAEPFPEVEPEIERVRDVVRREVAAKGAWVVEGHNFLFRTS